MRGRRDCVCDMCFWMTRVCVCGWCWSDCILTRAIAGQDSAVVDMFDSGTGRWSTSELSQARNGLSATSVGTVALFAGGGFDGTLFAEYIFLQLVLS